MRVRRSLTRAIAVGATLVAVGTIGLVLRWGTSGRAGTPPFEAAVLVLGVTTPLASTLLGWHLWRQGHRGGALASGTPLALMLLGIAAGRAGAPLSLAALLWLDLYVLLVFVAVLARYGRVLLRPPA